MTAITAIPAVANMTVVANKIPSGCFVDRCTSLPSGPSTVIDRFVEWGCQGECSSGCVPIRTGVEFSFTSRWSAEHLSGCKDQGWGSGKGALEPPVASQGRWLG